MTNSDRTLVAQDPGYRVDVSYQPQMELRDLISGNVDGCATSRDRGNTPKNPYTAVIQIVLQWFNLHPVQSCYSGSQGVNCRLTTSGYVTHLPSKLRVVCLRSDTRHSKRCRRENTI